MFKDGFYTALGTPVDVGGGINEKSLQKQIADQINAGASGLLLLGSMGYQPCIRDSAYAQALKVGSKAAAGKCPIFAGVMDNSVGRVMDRVKTAGDAKLDGVVATTPFYFVMTGVEIKAFFSAIANASKYPVYLYDLPAVTKNKITPDIVLEAMKHPNIKGIKTGDLALAREITHHRDARPDFKVFFSGLDIVDVAYGYCIRKFLDGMFACTPRNAAAMASCLAAGDMEGGHTHLDRILAMRQVFIDHGILPTFTAAMNILGYEGIFNPDYCAPVGPEAVEKTRAKLREIGEL